MLDKGPGAPVRYFQVVRVYTADLLGIYHLAPVPITSERRGDARQAYGGTWRYEPIGGSSSLTGVGEP
jgi:hypothetical protein